MSRVRHRLSVGLAVLAWLLASGTQWDAVQVFAWARMFAENARELSVADALSRTFSPEGRCELCRVVTKAKQEQSDPTLPAPTNETKIVLLCEPMPTLVITPPRRERWVATVRSARSNLRPRPQVPPPRG